MTRQVTVNFCCLGQSASTSANTFRMDVPVSWTGLELSREIVRLGRERNCDCLDVPNRGPPRLFCNGQSIGKNRRVNEVIGTIKDPVLVALLSVIIVAPPPPAAMSFEEAVRVLEDAGWDHENAEAAMRHFGDANEAADQLAAGWTREFVEMTGVGAPALGALTPEQREQIGILSSFFPRKRPLDLYEALARADWNLQVAAELLSID